MRLDQECSGWGSGRPADPEPTSDVGVSGQKLDGEHTRRRKRKKRRREAELRGGPSGYVICVGLILLIWAALVGASFIQKAAAYGLASFGLFTMCVGLIYVHFSAKLEGVERMTFLNSTPQSAIGVFVVMLIELAVLPIFCLFYLVFYFETAWKPVLIEFIGLAMLATGVALVIRF